MTAQSQDRTALAVPARALAPTLFAKALGVLPRKRVGAAPAAPGVGPAGPRRPRLLPLRPAPAAPPRFDRDAPLLGRIGSLVVRLARSPAELRAAQRLRFEVFFREMNARPSPVQIVTRRDGDVFDRFCDHLVVLDEARPGPPEAQIVATYRLLDQAGAARAGGFYSAGEFDIAPLLARHPHRCFLELGRSCVLKPYRGRRAAELLWQGIWAYMLARGIDVLFGCASLEGVDPDELALPLACLREHAAAPPEWRARARLGRAAVVRAETLPADPRRAMAALPPLLKGYLRVGAFVSSEAVVDPHFGTTDVFVVLPRERIAARYLGHYGEDAARFAA